MPSYASLLSTRSTGQSNSASLAVSHFGPSYSSPPSKKSKIQSNNLAPAILDGLMPITTEEEPEDIDDDAPARVRLSI